MVSISKEHFTIEDMRDALVDIMSEDAAVKNYSMEDVAALTEAITDMDVSCIAEMFFEFIRKGRVQYKTIEGSTNWFDELAIDPEEDSEGYPSLID
jgi:hypothetical protein